jgi:addiction module RelE/StbE family toxin
MKFVLTRQFKKKVAKFPQKLRTSLAIRLRIFAREPFHPLLNNHKLEGSLRSFRSINISGDHRLIYEEVSATSIILIDIDTHHNLYGR